MRIERRRTYEKSLAPGPPASGVPEGFCASAEPALILRSSGVFQGSFFVCSRVFVIDAYLSSARLGQSKSALNRHRGGLQQPTRRLAATAAGRIGSRSE